MIAFGAEEWARAWLRETKVPFPLLLDPDRALYRAYGLERSVARTWTPRTIGYYMRQVLTGRRLHGVQGDPYQLGGDFIVDSAGRLRFAYRSRDPVDRPAPETLLDTLRIIENERP